GCPQTNRKTDTGKTLKPWPVLVDHYKENMKEIIPDRVFFYRSATLGEHHRKETLQANVRSWH
ncbi:hypothetical protein, partial [Citrobacter freundii]|uniref:hypothetical protein n=1 Tax=Citrobacter freundii TaxID=546 RepID=UPI0035E3DDE4